MGTGCLETVFIRDIGDCIHESVGARVRIRSLHYLRLQLRAGVLQETLLISSNSVRCFVAAIKYTFGSH